MSTKRPLVIFIHTGKAEYNQAIAKKITAALTTQGFPHLEIKMGLTGKEPGLTDEEIILELDNATPSRTVLIGKPSRDSRRWNPAIEARKRKITTIVWTKHTYHVKALKDFGAILISGVRNKENAINLLVSSACAAVQAHADDHISVR